jgi:hypothetical protein
MLIYWDIFLGAPGALRGHHEPEKIRHAAIRTVAFLSEA